MGWVSTPLSYEWMLVDYGALEQNMDMSLPEQPDYSAERVTRPPRLIRRLSTERDVVGTSGDYLVAMSAQYESDDAHSVNMLQLKRMANFTTNPNKSAEFPQRYTDAFYKGQVLGYRVGDYMIGAEWPSTAYKVFNENMRLHLAAHNDTSLSQDENLQQMANALIQLLEKSEDSSIPVFLDEMILEWVDQTSDDLVEQAYTIMGFRHIVRQLNGTDVVCMQVSNKFFKLMDRNRIDDRAASETVSLDTAREEMMELYADHRLKFGDFDENDIARATELVHYLNVHMTQDLLEMKDLGVGDDISVSGEAMYYVLDNNATRHTVDLLSEREILKGTVDGVTIAGVMTNESIPIMRQSKIDPKTDTSRAGQNPLGVMLLLRDPLLKDGNGKIHFPPKGSAVGLVMNNPNMTISKYR